MPFYVAGSRSTIVWEAEEAIFKSANIGRNEPINSSDSIWKVVAGIFKVVQFGIFYYSRKKRVWQIYRPVCVGTKAGQWSMHNGFKCRIRHLLEWNFG